MSEQRFSSYIAGQWVEGDGSHADENPADLASPVGGYGVLDALRRAGVSRVIMLRARRDTA